MKITQQESTAIAQILDGFPLPEQLGCLTTLIFAHIIAACNNDLARAEPVVNELLHALPKHWELTKAAYSLDRLQPTEATRH